MPDMISGRDSMPSEFSSAYDIVRWRAAVTRSADVTAKRSGGSARNAISRALAIRFGVLVERAAGRANTT